MDNYQNLGEDKSYYYVIFSHLINLDKKSVNNISLANFAMCNQFIYSLALPLLFISSEVNACQNKLEESTIQFCTSTSARLTRIELPCEKIKRWAMEWQSFNQNKLKVGFPPLEFCWKDRNDYLEKGLTFFRIRELFNTSIAFDVVHSSKKNPTSGSGENGEYFFAREINFKEREYLSAKNTELVLYWKKQKKDNPPLVINTPEQAWLMAVSNPNYRLNERTFEILYNSCIKEY